MRDRPSGRVPLFDYVELQWGMVEFPERHPYQIPAIKHLKRLELHPAVTFLVGENGSGKSTLLEAMAARLDFEDIGGSARASFSRRPVDGGLHDTLRINKSPGRHLADRFFLRAETVFDFANKMDDEGTEDGRAWSNYGGRSLHTRSHGEAFLAIVQNRLSEESFILMDEPEAALSPTRQLSLIKEIDWLVRGGSQFVIATHSPIVLAYPDSQIYVLSEEGFVLTPYQETEHYELTKSFLNKPEAYLRHLVE